MQSPATTPTFRPLGWIATALVVGFGILLVFMVGKANTSNEVYWTRLLYVYGAAEAIAFAAVGWLFGREVNRERAQTAEERSDAAYQSEKAARDRASRAEEDLYSLSAAVKSGTRRDEREGEELLGDLKPNEALIHLRSLNQLANLMLKRVEDRAESL